MREKEKKAEGRERQILISFVVCISRPATGAFVEAAILAIPTNTTQYVKMTT